MPRPPLQPFRLLILLLASAGIARSAALPRRIDSWLVCGTFPYAQEADLDADPIGETDAAPSVGASSAGHPWRFFDDRLYCRNLDDYNDLYTFFSSVRQGSPGEATEDRFAYVHTYVWSPRAQEVQLQVGANDSYRAWLNGHLLGERRSRMHRALRDEEALAAPLAAGWNRLLLKIGNAHGVWGFYAALTDLAGEPLSGLAYALDPPGGDLAVATEALPTGYVQQPYVWLAIAGAAPTAQTPSASPFRLRARGGTPPYRWAFSVQRTPPPGLWLDGPEGELRGVCGQIGRFPVVVQVTDARGAIARAPLTLEVKDRVTRWLEEARIGGHMHGARGYTPLHGDPEEQGRQMGREGYSYAKQTAGWWIGTKDWPGPIDEKRKAVGEKSAYGHSGHQDLTAYAAAFRKNGVRFGTYIGLPDPMQYLFPDHDYTLWPRYLDFLHAHFQALCVEYQPALLYLDGVATKGRDSSDGPREPRDWDLDAIYSLVKTINPECLLMTNTQGDNVAGDADTISVEGFNSGPAYWGNWPQGPTGRNPKFLPVATWRYPFAWKQWVGRREKPARYRDEPDYLDPDEWCRVVVSLVSEGFIADLDHTCGYGREAMHEKIGDWLQPRLASLLGTHPGPLRPQPWGYNVERGDIIYLHILRNGRGKTGQIEGDLIQIGPLPRAVQSVKTFPTGEALPFQQQGPELSIDTRALKADAVDTIIEINSEAAP